MRHHGWRKTSTCPRGSSPWPSCHALKAEDPGEPRGVEAAAGTPGGFDGGHILPHDECVAVAARALGTAKMVSEDALLRALQRMDRTASAAWMRTSLMHSVREALNRPWVMDIDASIKPLFGSQEGAVIGYNPSKPMRPSHVLRTFLVSSAYGGATGITAALHNQVTRPGRHASGTKPQSPMAAAPC
jgi:hypothetical protein